MPDRDDHRAAIDLTSQGVQFAKKGLLKEAEDSLRRAIESGPGYLLARQNLALVLESLEDVTGAIGCFESLLAEAPRRAEVHNKLGTLYAKQGRFEDALNHFRQALLLGYVRASVHGDIGSALGNLGRHAEAATTLRQAIHLDPTCADYFAGLGLALTWADKYAEAEDCLTKALLLEPDHANAHLNFAFLLLTTGRLDKAICHYRRTIQLKPLDAKARQGLAACYLLQGDFERGWDEYEWRWKAGVLQPRELRQPQWNGETLEGRVILLHAEQGFGDTIQFIRYASMVKRLGGTVVVECQNELIEVLKRCPGIDQLISDGVDLPKFDTHSPLLSLPHILKTTLETIPTSIPYVYAEPGLVNYWHNQLRDVREFRIGINWHGRIGKGKFVQRDIPLECFGALSGIPGIRLVRLQKEVSIDALADAKARLRLREIGEDFDESHGAFMDTAAIMMNLDLVLTSDTSMAHVAGALGVPVWVALPFVPNWRWLLERNDSPWYPTMRLYRQKSPGDWTSVFDEIRAALHATLQNGKPLLNPS